jgi:hypothetical protein
MISIVTSTRSRRFQGPHERCFGAQASDLVLQQPVFQSINLAVGALCTLGLTAAAAIFCRRILQARQTGKTW